MKWYIKIGLILSIILYIYIYISYADFSPKEDKLLIRIHELELKIDSLSNKKDSIRTIIDSTHVKIITNEKHYQERINTIISQPMSLDSEYVSNYIGRYIESHSSYFQ